MQSAEQAPGFGGDDQDDQDADDAGDDADEQGQPGQPTQQVDPWADPGAQPMRKANDEHDLLTGQFSGRTHQVRLEKRSLNELYDFTKKYPLAAPDSMLVNMGEDDLRVQIDHGPAVEVGDGRIEVTGKRLSRQFGTTKGSGMVKVIWRHGEKSAKPEGMRVTRGDVMALPEVVRSMPSSIALDANEDPVRWEWQRKRFDGKTVIYAGSRFKAKDDHNHVVSINVAAPEMLKSDSNPGGELFALKHRIPACDLSIVHQAVEPLAFYYADDISLVNAGVFAKAIPAATLQAKGGQPEEEAKPHPGSHGVGVNDEVFFHYPQNGTSSGKILTYGADGFVVSGVVNISNGMTSVDFDSVWQAPSYDLSKGVAPIWREDLHIRDEHDQFHRSLITSVLEAASSR